MMVPPRPFVYCAAEIKQLVDKATRFFWAASYGQIYPLLKQNNLYAR